MNQRGSHWAYVPVSLLAASFFGVGSMAVIAIRDPSFSTEPDYYRKAVDWNQTQAQAGENQRLGYQLRVSPVVRVGRSPRVELELQLKDRDGRPVSGARLRAQAFANALSSRIVTIGFEEQAPGAYRASFVPGQLGVWELRVTGDARAAHFTAILRTELRRGDDA